MKKKNQFLIIPAVILAAFFIFLSGRVSAAGYDLKAESLTMNSTKCEVNKMCAFTARIKNIGSPFTLDFSPKTSISSANLTDAYASFTPSVGATINTNDYLVYNLSGVYTKIGSTTLNFSIDPAGYLTESNTRNNSVSLSFKVVGYDLAVESLTLSPPKPMVNQDCLILIKVKNNSSYSLSDGDGLEAEKILPGFTITGASSTQPSFSKIVSSGGYLYYGYEGRFATAGEKSLYFKIDPKDVLKESDLANNAKTFKAVVYEAAEADLIFSSVIISTSTPKIVAGLPFEMFISLKNTGKTSITGSAGLTRDELGQNFDAYAYGIYELTAGSFPTISRPLNPGDVFQYKYRGALSRAGNYNLNFTLNKNRQLVEGNFENNSTTTPITVYASQTAADQFSVLSRSLEPASSTAVIIKWTTDAKTMGAVNYSQVGYNVSQFQAKVATATLEHAVTLNQLLPGMSYVYTITNKSGEVEKTETPATFTVPENNALKIIAGPTVAVSGRNVNISWTTNLAASGWVYYKKKETTALSRAGSETITSEHRMDLKDLALGQYDYYLISTSTPKTSLKTAWSSFEIKDATTATGSQNPLPSNSALVSYPVASETLFNQLKGRIILRVEKNGEAYYVSPKDKKLYFLGRPDDAFPIIRNQAVGMTDLNLVKLPIGLDAVSGSDADADGLPDALEAAIGTDPDKIDTDGDGFGDKAEILSGNSPLAKNTKLVFDSTLIFRFKGQILLQVQGHGEAWYIYPADSKRYFLSQPADAFNIMRKLGLGITEKNYQALGGK